MEILHCQKAEFIDRLQEYNATLHPRSPKS